MKAFIAKKSTLSAAHKRAVQQTSTLIQIPGTDTAIGEAVAVYRKTVKDHILMLLLLQPPDRDCSGGDSCSERSSEDDGLNKYKVWPLMVCKKGSEPLRGIDFAIILEPDSLGNTVMNCRVDYCKIAA